MNKQRYLDMCEELGIEVDDSKVPVDFSDFPYEIQEIIEIYNFLPNIWEGFSGTYLGKDYGILPELLNIYEIEDRKLSLYFLKKIDYIRSDILSNKAKIKESSQVNNKKPRK